MIIGIMIGLAAGLLVGSTTVHALFDRLTEAKLRNNVLTSKVHQLQTGKELA
jgi:hypothetical protein